MDAAYLLDWGNLLLRWLHVIVGIAWIGASFYFVLLDNSLKPPVAQDLKDKGVTGELWAVHGGGFYNPQKYFPGPPKLPDAHLHWFYWESYWTWMSGFALFVLLYLFNAETYLIDKSVADLPKWGAIALALGFLVAGWLAYDAICRVFGRTRDGQIGNDHVVLIGIFVFVVFASWLACQLFAGRAAFLIIGAMIGTMMSANVFFWIIPGQKKVIAELAAGQPVTAIHGQRGKQRSVHNTYFTLPVLIAMLSNHYIMVYTHPHNWLVLVWLMLIGALIRTWFVQRHTQRAQPGLVFLVAGLLVGLIVFVADRDGKPVRLFAPVAVAAKPVLASAPAASTPEAGGFAQVRAVLDQRCAMCHNAANAQKGVQLHTPELVAKHAQNVYQQVVVTRQMPMNNATGITEAERQAVAAWFKAGAPTQ
jgi:uncharacterized membrane protein